MLKHVGGVDRIGGVRRKGKTVSSVQPEINPGKGISVNIEKAWKVLGAASKVQMDRRPRGANTPKQSLHEVVGKSGFRNTPEGNVFIALMKQFNPRECESLIIVHSI